MIFVKDKYLFPGFEDLFAVPYSPSKYSSAMDFAPFKKRNGK
jgi:hypothetical protein